MNFRMMESENDLKVEIKIPFPSERLAQIAYDVLRVDAEPKRSGVTKVISYNSNTLQATFSGQLARQIRVAVGGFFDNIALIAETIEFAGEPTSQSYSHFS